MDLLDDFLDRRKSARERPVLVALTAAEVKRLWAAGEGAVLREIRRRMIVARERNAADRQIDG